MGVLPPFDEFAQLLRRIPNSTRQGIFDVAVQEISVKTQLRACESLALAGPTVIRVVMFEAKKGQVLWAIVAGVPIEMGNLPALDFDVPIQAITETTASTAGLQERPPATQVLWPSASSSTQRTC